MRGSPEKLTAFPWSIRYPSLVIVRTENWVLIGFVVPGFKTFVMMIVIAVVQAHPVGQTPEILIDLMLVSG